jgi:hypothetical protein
VAPSGLSAPTEWVRLPPGPLRAGHPCGPDETVPSRGFGSKLLPTCSRALRETMSCLPTRCTCLHRAAPGFWLCKANVRMTLHFLALACAIFRSVGETGFEPATARPPAEVRLRALRLYASRASRASLGHRCSEALDDGVGTNAVPRPVEHEEGKTSRTLASGALLASGAVARASAFMRKRQLADGRRRHLPPPQRSSRTNLRSRRPAMRHG